MHTKNMKKVFTVKSYAFLPTKFDLKMKLTTLFLIVSLFQLQATESYAQKTKVSLTMENVSIEKVLDRIESLTEFKFIYKDNDVDYQRKVTVNVKNKQIRFILETLFAGSNVTYKVVEKQIILKPSETIIIKNNVKTPITNHDRSQGFVINGNIKGADGQPLPGANIVEKGTNNGTQTDFDGNYTLTLTNSQAVIVVSYLGYKTQEVTVSGTTAINIVLEEDTAELDEVVVVGFGKTSKKKLAASVAQVSGEELQIEERPVTSIQGALVGSVPGLIANNGSGGRPGTLPSLAIRGRSSLNNTNILVIIDGFEGNLADIDPKDVQTATVLKDASAVAIYGVRGANGVLLITTKDTKKNDVVQ
jgi:TonB-dependent SusC/RagA subfamily outer membrane receptor